MSYVLSYTGPEFVRSARLNSPHFHWYGHGFSHRYPASKNINTLAARWCKQQSNAAVTATRQGAGNVSMPHTRCAVIAIAIYQDPNHSFTRTPSFSVTEYPEDDHQHPHEITRMSCTMSIKHTSAHHTFVCIPCF